MLIHSKVNVLLHVHITLEMKNHLTSIAKHAVANKEDTAYPSVFVMKLAQFENKVVIAKSKNAEQKNVYALIIINSVIHTFATIASENQTRKIIVETAK